MKRVLITGASEGIGRELAVAFAGAGFAVTGVARTLSVLETTLAGLPGSGHVAIAADLADTDGLTLITHEVAQGEYDALINNAGFGLDGDFARNEMRDYQRMIDLNISALTTLSHEYLRRARSGDALINIASVVAYMPYPRGPVYAASKAYVKSLTEGLWAQARPAGVRVLCVCPGATDTRFHRIASGASTPLVRVGMQTPHDVARTTLEAYYSHTSPVVICGAQNMMFVFLSRLLPSRALLALVSKIIPS